MLTQFVSLGLFALGVLAGGSGGHDDLTVDTGLFTVRGTLETNMSTVRVFRGVPYAESPVGNLRFKPPVHKKPTAEIIDATKFGPSCIQLNTGAKTVYTEYMTGFLLTPGQTTSEDCLSLNIWAPRHSAGKSLPVLLFIPGGGFTSGGSASPYKYGGGYGGYVERLMLTHARADRPRSARRHCGHHELSGQYLWLS
jgi:hypothetical protein